jgi:hypothetical protein
MFLTLVDQASQAWAHPRPNRSAARHSPHCPTETRGGRESDGSPEEDDALLSNFLCVRSLQQNEVMPQLASLLARFLFPNLIRKMARIVNVRPTQICTRTSRDGMVSIVILEGGKTAHTRLPPLSRHSTPQVPFSRQSQCLNMHAADVVGHISPRSRLWQQIWPFTERPAHLAVVRHPTQTRTPSSCTGLGKIIYRV